MAGVSIEERDAVLWLQDLFSGSSCLCFDLIVESEEFVRCVHYYNKTPRIF